MAEGEFYNCYTFDYIEISHCKRDKPFNMPQNHYHDSCELYYLISGERYYFIKDRTYHIMAGDLVFISRDELHKTTTSGNPSHERVLINFNKEFFGHLLDDITDIHMLCALKQCGNVIRLTASQQCFVENLLSKILEECKNRQEGYITYIKIMMIELLIFLNRNCRENLPHKFEHPSSVHKKISDIVRYINQHYMENITLSSLSRKFYISPYYLSRVFKETTGFAFTEYLNSVRTKEAQKLLKSTKLNITQVAQKVGYENTTHFGRVFKSVTGIPPSAYRKIEKH